MDFTQFASLGVGGILAGMMFWFYRQDRLDASKRWDELIGRLNDQAHQRMAVIVAMQERSLKAEAEMTKVISDLAVALRENAASADRREGRSR